MFLPVRSILINTDRIEVIEVNTEPSIKILARMDSGRCYCLGDYETEAEAADALTIIMGCLSKAEDVKQMVEFLVREEDDGK